MTFSWHLDDLKVYLVNTKIVDEFIEWIKTTNWTIGEVKPTHVKVHIYHGMKLGYSTRGQASINVIDNVKSMIENFPSEELTNANVSSPWNES